MYPTPILLVLFNRPQKTKKLFEVLRRIKPEILYVSMDGPRNNVETDGVKCEKIRKLVAEIDWAKNIQLLDHNKNLGCHLAPRKAIEWFFKENEAGIILEDDCIPHPDFFPFCTEMLSKYKNDNRIFTINGSNLGYHTDSKYSYSFCRFMNMTGWATWSRTSDSIDYYLDAWKKNRSKSFFLYTKLRNHIFDLDINWFLYWRNIFNKTVECHTVNWWDYHWIFNQVNSRKLSVVPKVNLVTNIGFDEEGTHTKSTEDPAANIKTESLTFPLVHPKRIKINYEYEEKIAKPKWALYNRLPFVFYLKKYIALIIKK